MERWSLGCFVLLVAVVGDEAGRAPDVLENRGAGARSQVLDEGSDLVNVRDALEGHEVGSKTGNVGRGYRVC